MVHCGAQSEEASASAVATQQWMAWGTHRARGWIWSYAALIRDSRKVALRTRPSQGLVIQQQRLLLYLVAVAVLAIGDASPTAQHEAKHTQRFVLCRVL